MVYISSNIRVVLLATGLFLLFTGCDKDKDTPDSLPKINPDGTVSPDERLDPNELIILQKRLEKLVKEKEKERYGMPTYKMHPDIIPPKEIEIDTEGHL